MRRPRVQFTVRRMMVAVAIVGIMAAGASLGRRRAHYKLQALKHEVLQEIFLRGHADVGSHASRASHHGALRIKYERAARHPWLPVAADPPAPE